MPDRRGYPVHLMNLTGARVLLVGGGSVAAEKLPPLLDAGARVHLVAREVRPALDPLRARLDRVEVRSVRPSDVLGARLVIAATDDREVNRMVVDAARAAGILANAVDDKELCDFYAPASIRRGRALISVSSDGGSPLLSARIRRMLEAALPPSLDEVSELFVAMRARGLRGLARRSRILRALASPVVAGLVDRGEREAALDRLQAIADAPEEAFRPGTVAIVGAGPGGVGHLTLRALDRIQRADVILHDALVDPEILALASPGARRIDVGRRCSGLTHSVPTPATLRVELMLREARAGHRVVRLHAGDPFVFGRGGEEMDALADGGVPFEAVPGVSAVLAAPAAAGVPLTQRTLSRGFSVRTGHTRDGYTRAELPPDQETVVVLMGLGAMEDILEGLIEEGRSPDTPAVAVASVGRAEERVVTGTLATLAGAVRAAELTSPTTLIVGDVARRAAAAEESALGEGGAAA